MTGFGNRLLRLPICGGNWNNAANAGVFNVNLNNARTNSNSNIGFRSALLSMPELPRSKNPEAERENKGTCFRSELSKIAFPIFEPGKPGFEIGEKRKSAGGLLARRRTVVEAASSRNLWKLLHTTNGRR